MIITRDLIDMIIIFYVKCRDCNSLIKITIEEANEILNNCGYECEHYLYPLNFSETKWKDDYPNNFKQIDHFLV